MNYIFTLLTALLLAPAAALPAAESRELFQDTAFAQGFGAAWSYGAKFTGERKEGRLLAYRKITPCQVHLIPEGPVQPDDPRAHPWDFEEGLHLNFTDHAGLLVPELHEHRFAANHVIETNTPGRLQFAQFNNYRLTAGDPRRNQRLVKRVSTDRQGTIRLYYNSSNEVRNAATAYAAQFANDTWPHLLLVQQFPDAPRLEEFERLEIHAGAGFGLSKWPVFRGGFGVG
jgi:hypothetical protein